MIFTSEKAGNAGTGAKVVWSKCGSFQQLPNGCGSFINGFGLWQRLGRTDLK
jgi:hypothetical protein